MKNTQVWLAMVTWLLLGLVGSTSEPNLRVDLDVTEVPEHAAWGRHAKQLIEEWTPRIHNLLLCQGAKLPESIALKIEKTDKGIAATSGARIVVSSHWIDEHPDDIGLVLHELVHVIQAYPPGGPGWVTEGVADYLRWGIFEGKELSWFPRPKGPQGYRRSYQVAGGFLLWLEAGKAPGIVRQLNAAMRQGNYNDDIFRKATLQSLDELWDEYVSDVKPDTTKPDDESRFQPPSRASRHASAPHSRPLQGVSTRGRPIANSAVSRRICNAGGGT